MTRPFCIAVIIKFLMDLALIGKKERASQHTFLTVFLNRVIEGEKDVIVRHSLDTGIT